jgi:glutamate-ammonia-ligase adenylyltransferase
LTEAYKGLRSAYHRSALQEQPTTIPDERLAQPRERVRSIWRELMQNEPDQ